MRWTESFQLTDNNAIRASSKVFVDLLKEQQGAWLRDRRVCAEVQNSERARHCLLALYDQRLRELLKPKKPQVAPKSQRLSLTVKEEVLQSEFLTDGARVFCRNTRRLIPEADAKTFISLEHSYGKDAKHVFHYEEMLSDADLKTFRILKPQSNYALDGFHVYEGSKVIAGADPATFIALGNGYSKDATHVFKELQVQAGMNPKTLVIEGSLVKTDKSVEFDGIDFPGVDPKSFRIIKDNAGSKNHTIYAGDHKNVFYHGGWGQNEQTMIKDADVSTFEVLDEQSYGSPYAKDKRSVYFGAEKVRGADPTTFRDLNPFGVDARSAFYGGTRIEVADPKTFTVMLLKNSGFSGNVSDYAKDARFVFYKGSKVPRGGPKTFKVFDPDQHVDASDKNFKYSIG